MNKRLNTSAQGGFTLIELIVVIVILGILAATALPKFTALSGDARLAALNAARGSVNSVVAMAHGRALVSATTAGNVTFEGSTVVLVNGYPSAGAGTSAAAGLGSTDYTIIAPSTAVASPAVAPATGPKQFAIIPKALEGTASGATCYVMYTEAADVNTPPTVTLTGSGDTCK